MTEPIKLPPLPDIPAAICPWDHSEGVVIKLLQAYATAAIEADRQQREKDLRLCEEALEVEIQHSRRLQKELDELKADRQARGEVAYLDLGVGGYMDVGTDLTDEQLAALPKGRHMLGIIGTYGVDGYREAALQPTKPQECGCCGRSNGCDPDCDAAQPADLVKVPSDIELDDLADDFHGYAGNYTRHGYPIPKFNHVGYARALLARHGNPHIGQPAQPAEPVNTDSAGYTFGPISDGGIDPRNEQAKPVRAEFPDAVEHYGTAHDPAADHKLSAEPVKVPVDTPEALRFAARVVELYDDATMVNDYMIDSGECAGILNALADYFARFAPQPQQIPEGYKLVPIEPTDKMLGAALHHIDGMACMPAAYKAMLEAAREVKE